jgi:hypothetical protein
LFVNDYEYLEMLANERRDRSASALRAHYAKQSLRGPRRRRLFQRRSRRDAA